MCLQIFIHAFRHFPWPGRWGQWPWLFRRPHLVHGHNPHSWNFIYNPQKLLYLLAIVEETLTSVRQIYFFVSNFNFIYIYIKLKKLRDTPHIFWRNTQKLAIRENCASEENKCTLFCCYSSSENINCHSIHAARKKYVNNIKRALDFYYYSPFLYGNTLSFSTYGTDGRLDGYLPLWCIY